MSNFTNNMNYTIIDIVYLVSKMSIFTNNPSIDH